ncbi:hypothetical protein [Actinomadura harenae]|uniref:hypothetical protein n=1 Tax=Actinomadura harenae TaxID=2483351 RepID=UPI0011C42A7E|nr:hypothetical protein [Actinomadura harenae]
MALGLAGCLAAGCGTVNILSPTTAHDVTFRKVIGEDENIPRRTRAFIVGFIGAVRRGDTKATLKRLEAKPRYQTADIKALASWLTTQARADFMGPINVSGHPGTVPLNTIACFTFGKVEHPRRRLGFNVAHRGREWWVAAPLGPPAPGKSDPYPPITSCACKGCEF